MPRRLARAAVHCAPLLGAVLILRAAASVRAAEPAHDDPKPGWRNGPVRYVLTAAEDKAYKALKTDEERAKAIAEFWSERDPTPGTAANEYRDEFAKRVEEAGREFRETTSPGWATERGRVLLVAGYPKDKSGSDENEVWAYEMLAGLDQLFEATDGALARAAQPGAPIPPVSAEALEARKALKQTLSSGQKISFRKNENGDYDLEQGSEIVNAVRKLSPRDGALVSMSRPALMAAMKSLSPAAKPATPAPAGSAPALGGATAAAGKAAPEAAAELPPGVDRLRSAALATEPRAEIGLAVSARYYKAEDGSTRAVIMAALKKADIASGPDGKPRAILYARLTPQGEADAAPVEFIEQELFSLYDDPGEGWLKYAFAWALKKRAYELRVAASDGAEGKLATHTESLVLPDFKSGEFALSSVTLARSAAPPAPETPADDRFKVGALRLVPWVSPSLGPKDDLAVFYDVYNAKIDPSTGHPALDASYIIEKKSAAGWKPLGRVADPDKHEETLGYTIPAESMVKWPAGEYRMTVQIKDKIANVEKSAAVEFSLKK